MNKFISILMCSFIMVSSLLFVWHRLQGININFKSNRLYISLFGLTILTSINYSWVSEFFKIIIITSIFVIFFMYLFKSDIKMAIISSIFYQIIIMISECIVILILVSLLKLDLNNLKIQFLGTFIVNISTTIISLIIGYLPITKKFFKYIVSTISKIRKIFLVMLSLIVMIIANILAAITYYHVDIRVLVLIDVSFSLVCFVIILYTFRTQNNYNKVSDKYNIAINSLNDYEEMMTRYRIENHENKNLLLTIRAMVMNKEKDIPKYINTIVEDKYDDNENLLKKMSIIPSGGLRATIYSEILKIQNYNINYILDIDEKIKTFDLIEIGTDDIIDICKIIGVLIDNAIEAVSELDDKNIEISLYENNKELNIKVSNNYKGSIEVDKIFEEGYTTKGDGHGFGLSLVKKIIDANDNFSNKIELSDKIFSQILSIKK